MSKLTEALEAWRAASRDLDAATPWTADWLRARMDEEERRRDYRAIADEVEPEVPAEAERVYAPVD
jgi:hypothetical protein